MSGLVSVAANCEDDLAVSRSGYRSVDVLMVYSAEKTQIYHIIFVFDLTPKTGKHHQFLFFPV